MARSSLAVPRQNRSRTTTYSARAATREVIFRNASWVPCLGNASGHSWGDLWWVLGRLRRFPSPPRDGSCVLVSASGRMSLIVRLALLLHASLAAVGAALPLLPLRVVGDGRPDLACLLAAYLGVLLALVCACAGTACDRPRVSASEFACAVRCGPCSR